MKKVILLFAAIGGTLSMNAQNNPNANPITWGINAAASPIEVGQVTTTTFSLGNTGSDPIPAGGVSFSVSFPPNVTVNQASLFMDGGGALFTSNWFVDGSGTYLTLDVVGAGIPPFILGGPQTRFNMTVQITGATAGPVALQQTINALPNATVAQNLNPGDDNADGPIRVVPAGALPINLVSFTGKRIDKNTARLNWEVNNPDKFSHFELERSMDGAGYSKVAKVMLTTAQRYEQDDDISKVKDRVLYRLRMVDLDGTSSLSPVVAFQHDGERQALSVYPNPVLRGGRLAVTADQINDIQVFNASGIRLLNKQYKGESLVVIPVEQWAAGTYTIRINGGQQVARFVVK